MNRYSKVVLCLVFTVISFSVFSQSPDVIIQKNGSKIRCRILDQDSVWLYYSLGNQKTLFTIKKEDVEEYTIASPPASNTTNNTPGSSAPPARANTAEQPYGQMKTKELLLFNFTTGVALPIGDFGSKNINSTSAGAANLGYLAQGSVVLKVSKFVGISLGYRYQANGADADTYTQAFRSFLTAAAGPIPSNVGLNSDAGSWTMAGPTGGAVFTIPVSKTNKVYLDAELSLGYFNVISPQVNMTATQGGSTIITLNQGSSQVWAFGSYNSFGVRYKYTDNIAIHCNLNVFNVSASFTHAPLTLSVKGQGSQTQYSNPDQQITTIGLQVGLTFMLY